MSEARIESIERGDLRLRLLLWEEEGRLRVAWQQWDQSTWHGVSGHFASTEDAVEGGIAALEFYLRFGRRARQRRLHPSTAAETGPEAAGPATQRKPLVSGDALRHAFGDPQPDSAVGHALFERALKLAFPRSRAHR